MARAAVARTVWAGAAAQAQAAAKTARPRWPDRHGREPMLMLLMLQTAQQVGRARYFASMRILWVLVVILLIAGIAVLVKKLMK
jgi:hypothetical protein